MHNVPILSHVALETIASHIFGVRAGPVQEGHPFRRILDLDSARRRAPRTLSHASVSDDWPTMISLQAHFYVDGRDYVWTRGPGLEGPSGYDRLSTRDATDLIEGWRFRDNVAALRCASAASGLQIAGSYSTQELPSTLVARLTEELENFSVLFRAQPEAESWAPPTDLDTATDLAELAGPAEVEDEWHWVEVEVLDADDKPVAGVECKIVLPNGQEKMCTSDDFGIVRVEQISEPGACKISFPSAPGISAM